jgi:hypothetical protein
VSQRDEHTRNGGGGGSEWFDSLQNEIVRVHKSEQCHLAKQVFDLVNVDDGRGRGEMPIIVSQWKKENEEHRKAFCESS